MATLECSSGSGLKPQEGEVQNGRVCRNEEGMGDLDWRFRQSCLQYLEAVWGKRKQTCFVLTHIRAPGSLRLSPEDRVVYVKDSALYVSERSRRDSGEDMLKSGILWMRQG